MALACSSSWSSVTWSSSDHRQWLTFGCVFGLTRKSALRTMRGRRQSTGQMRRRQVWQFTAVLASFKVNVVRSLLKDSYCIYSNDATCLQLRMIKILSWLQVLYIWTSFNSLSICTYRAGHERLHWYRFINIDHCRDSEYLTRYWSVLDLCIRSIAWYLHVK